MSDPITERVRRDALARYTRLVARAKKMQQAAVERHQRTLDAMNDADEALAEAEHNLESYRRAQGL